MLVVGWIALVVFALIGLAVVGYAAAEFFIVQIRLFHMKISREIEVLKEDINVRAELKKERLEKKRNAKNKVAHQKLDIKIEKKQDATDEKHGVPSNPAIISERQRPSHNNQGENDNSQH